MYSEKIEEILNDLEDKNLEIAGGSVVGMVLSTVNSLIKYIANLTVGKKNYAEVQDKVLEILKQADDLKNKSLNSIDKDKEVLEKILITYKKRKEMPEDYQMACKEAVEFGIEVLEVAYKTFELSEKISKVGNKMLSSDFKICKYYAEASIKSAKENVFINFESVQDIQFKERMNQIYLDMVKKYEGE